MKRYVSALMALCLMFTLVLPVEAKETETFSDVPTDFWAYEQINRCVQDGIVGGYNDGTFKPGSPVSYGAFSIMLARAFYASELAGYADQGTATGEAIMNKHGILNGTSRSSASIGASLPREDMAQVMYNILVDKGAKIPSDTEYLKAMGSISDFQSINNNCRRAVMVCYTTGLLGGQSDGSFGPKNPMNRAQGCVVINRLRDYMGNSGTTTPVEPSPEKPSEPITPVEPPEVTELPEFKLLAGENAQQMMDRINASITFTQGCLSNGKPITELNIQEILGFARETMPDGTPWDGADTYKYRSPKFGSYWGNAGKCAGFAACLSDYLFTSDAPLLKHQDFSQLKVGDVIDIRNSDNGVKHAIVITDIDWASGMYSWCSGNDGGTVRWRGGNGTGYLNTFEEPSIASGTYIYSRY